MNAGRGPLLVTADDSTGATEAGAACADAGLRVDVVPFGLSLPAVDGCVVVDLRSRHIAGPEARARIAAMTGVTHRVHKMDSTLRGNWPDELAQLVAAGRRVVMIPSHPLAGRVCVGGVVYVNGVPLADSDHADDLRHPVRSSRPSELLPADELRDADELASWLTRGSAQSAPRVAIVDARTPAEIERITEVALDRPDVVVTGPASVIGAVARIWAPGTHPVTLPHALLPNPWLPQPVVVVCASLHPVSRAQIANLADAGVDVVASGEERDGDPQRVAGDVADRAHELVRTRGARSVILVGGDTAAAFIGDNVVHVFGSIDVAVSLAETVIDGRPLRIASKPGGFGEPNTLVDLVRR